MFGFKRVVKAKHSRIRIAGMSVFESRNNGECVPASISHQIFGDMKYTRIVRLLILNSIKENFSPQEIRHFAVKTTTTTCNKFFSWVDLEAFAFDYDIRIDNRYNFETAGAPEGYYGEVIGPQTDRIVYLLWTKNKDDSHHILSLIK